MHHSKSLIGIILLLILIVSGCDTTMKLAGDLPSPAPKADPQEVLQKYLVQEHSFVSSHQSEVFFLVKFPSCSGSIDRIYTYMEESQFADRIRIMGIKDSTSPLSKKYEPFFQSVHTEFRDDHETFGLKTGIRVGYPEMYYFVDGQPTSRRVINCNNFDDAIDSAEAFLQTLPVTLTHG